ncbi:MAG: DUF3105 domain-containing protein [Candidatus Levybacteria bacterium]|nr:DUF3105 domain-containing protein [Candidatus Levybacteria bacterium]
MSNETKIIGGIGGLATLVLLIGGVFLLSGNDAKQQQKENKPFIGQKIADMGTGLHVKRGAEHEPYNSNPPTSGPHWGDGVAGAGIHDNVVPDELLVHSLEHGAAILWYKADLPKEQVETLKTIFAEASGKKIMVPRKNLDVPVALTSWNYLLKLKTIDAKKIKEFIETNNDRAPEKAPI